MLSKNFPIQSNFDHMRRETKLLHTSVRYINSFWTRENQYFAITSLLNWNWI